MAAAPDSTGLTTSALDSVLDNPATALPAIKEAVGKLAQLLDSKTDPAGMVVRVAGKIPSGDLPTLEYALNSDALSAISVLTPAANKIPYYTGASTAALTTLTVAMRTLLGAADLATFRQAAGLSVGSDVQAHHIELDELVVAGAAAAGDEETPPVVGFVKRLEDGQYVVGPAGETDLSIVPTMISSALEAYDRTLDAARFVTATEAYSRFAPLLDRHEMLLALGFPNRRGFGWDLQCWTVTVSPLTGFAAGTGSSYNSVASTSEHPGQTEIRSGTVAGSGYRIYAGAPKTMELNSGSYVECVFQIPTFAGATFLFGFNSDSDVEAGVNGAFFWLENSGAITPKTLNGGAATTGAGATLTADTWYRARVERLAAGARFTIRTAPTWDAAGTSVIDETLTTNLPVGAGHEVSPCLGAISSSTTSGQCIVRLSEYRGNMVY